MRGSEGGAVFDAAGGDDEVLPDFPVTAATNLGFTVVFGLLCADAKDPISRLMRRTRDK